MAHRICTSNAGEALPYFQRLWRTLLAPGIDPPTKLEQLFEHETVELDLHTAFLSSIDLENETERFELVHGPHEALQPGTIVPLSETYCRKTIADPEGTLAVSDAVAEGWEGDPAYDAFELGSYLGTTVSVADHLYGTLCFANATARDDPIRDEEKALVEMHGQWVASTLAAREESPFRATRTDPLEGRTVSPQAVDSMMSALENRTRRVLLATLLEDTDEVSLEAVVRRLDRENARIQLRHTHLPKLANSGYVQWDHDADTIARGPNFSELKPLVQLLNEYNTTFPE